MDIAKKISEHYLQKIKKGKEPEEIRFQNQQDVIQTVLETIPSNLLSINYEDSTLIVNPSDIEYLVFFDSNNVLTVCFKSCQKIDMIISKNKQIIELILKELSNRGCQHCKS